MKGFFFRQTVVYLWEQFYHWESAISLGKTMKTRNSAIANKNM